MVPVLPVIDIHAATVMRGQTKLLQGVSWRVAPEERWVVLGPNGAGKTTLLNLAAARLFPTEGTVQVLGETLGRVDVNELRTRIGLTTVALHDRIPPYRLNMCGRLPGLAHLTDVWRGPLGGVLPGSARRGLVVDCRSGEYATAWRPSGELAERTVVVRVGVASSYDAKYLRGLLARRIVTDAIDPRQPAELAGALSEHFKLELRPPDRPSRPWDLRVIEALA